uniref:ATP synthase complex subunit 8 n=1 Tax=Ips acuminatus TaxID=55980 RepID=A0A6H1XL50_9CUCU|nr:ATP synthase subunit 8 [Ips acuminatus]
MPQMAPMNWLLLFLFFSLLFIVSMLINYYFNLFNSISMNSTQTTIKLIKNKNFWKW